MDKIKFNENLKSIEPFSSNSIDELKEKFGFDKAYRLMSNESPYGASPEVYEAVISSINNSSYYPIGADRLLREKIASLYAVENDEIFFGNGADEIISLLGKVFLEEGDEFITSEATFGSYYKMANINNAKCIKIPLNNYGFDLEEISNNINENTKLIALVNPNNPTGTIFTENEQREFLKRVPKNIPVIIDEAYREFTHFVDFPDSIGMLKEFPNLIIIKTFSKIYGMASFRIGYAISNKEIITNLDKARNAFNVNNHAFAAANAALDDRNFTNMVYENNKNVRDYVQTTLDNMGLKYIPTTTNFIMIDINQNGDTLVNQLAKKGWFIQSGSVYGMDNFIRVSFGDMVTMVKFMEELNNILGD